VALVPIALGLRPCATHAQSLEWSVAGTMLLDTELVDGTKAGPGVSATVTLAPTRGLSYYGLISVARTDFPVASDQLHRNYASLAAGLRFARPSAGFRAGLTLGVGLLAWDDVSETDPGFRSSANAEEMLLPGVEASMPLASRWRLTLSARDQLTGWWNAILDPAEYGVSHRILLSVGLGSGAIGP
jgi:hypothetical protein